MPVDAKIEARLVLRLASLTEGVGIHGVVSEGIEAVDTHQIDMLREIISKGIDCCYSTLVTYGCLTVHAERIMAIGIVKRGI